MRGFVLNKAGNVFRPFPNCDIQSRCSSESAVAKLFLVRHGETHANRDRLIDGQTDSVLTELGKRQAVAAGNALNDVCFGLALSSDLPRAKSTAELLLGQNTTFERGRLQLETCKLLRERHFGTLDRVPTIEYMAHPEFDGWGGRFTPLGAETREEVRCRARQFLITLVSRISKSHAGKEEDNLLNCLIVSHGVVIMEFVRCLAREFKCYFPENATEELYENKVAPNASLTTFNFVVETSERGQAKVRDVMCLKLYCDRHLRCLAVNESV